MRRWVQGLGRDNRGMALLITIMVVSLLVGVTLQFARNVRQGFFASATQFEGQQLKAIARSGVAIGVALLEADLKENSVDTFHDSWAHTAPENLAGIFDLGTVALTVEDLSGRLQINSLVPPPGGDGGGETKVSEIKGILNQLLISGIVGEIGDEQAREIVDSLIDWLDPDDEESEFGAESGYYRSLATPHGCRNGPVRDIDELLQVKGVTPRLLYGEGERPGLVDLVTVYGSSGQLNLNTMPRLLMPALHPLMTEELAEMLDTFRQAEENAELLADPGWYRNVPGFPGDIDLPADLLSAKSFYFRLKSEGRLGERVRRVAAIVERKKEGPVEIMEIRME